MTTHRATARRSMSVAAIFGGLLLSLHAAHANTESYIDRFRDYAPEIDMNTFADLWSPTRNADGTESFYGVNSKWQQPRDVGTTPHQGVDLNSPLNTAVYPIEVGWIVYQSGYNTGGTGFVYDANGQVRYEMVIRVDWNYNGVQDDALFIKYDHLERVGFTATGSYVYTSDQVATSGDENGAYGAHLHFGLLYPKESGTNTGRWTGVERHYTWASNWNYGRDLDFISFLDVTTQNRIWASAYVMNDRVRSSLPSGSVTLLHRRPGESAWNSATMTGVAGDDYYIDLPALGYSTGQSVEWFVRALRPLSNEPHNAGFFPPRYAHPNNDPNAVAAAYPFYTTVPQ